MLEALNNKNKYGFSLFEVVVTMSIVAIFIAACSNVFTQRHKKRVSSPTHGRYECYRDESENVKYRLFNEGVLANSGAATDGKCKFTPPKYASYIIINAVGAGGHGGPVTGGSSGSYANVFLSTTDHVLEITPGKAAANASVARGESTIVSDIGKSGTESPKIVLDLAGGKSNSAGSTSFRDCTFANLAYDCGRSPVCTIKESDQVVEVRYCSAQGSGILDPGDSSLRTVEIPFKNSATNDDFNDGCNSHFPESKKITSILDTYSGTAIAELAKGIITYDYTKRKCTYSYTWDDAESITYFTINLSVDGNYSEYREASPFNGYVHALNISDGIATRDDSGNLISTGDGGGKNEKGGHGGVLVTW